MRNEQQPGSINTLFAAIRASAANGQLRDYRLDSALLLTLEGVRWTCVSAPVSASNKPNLIAANHFVRRPWQRMSPFNPQTFFTTRESAITTSIIAKEAGELSQRPVTWTVQDDLPEKVWSFTVADRQTQQAIIACYGLIPVGNKKGYEVLIPCREALYLGKNVGIYPEGKIGHTLRPADRAFEGLLALLQRTRVDFQILPVSLFFENGAFKLNIADPIAPQGKARELVDRTMRSIAGGLPLPLRGPYA